MRLPVDPFRGELGDGGNWLSALRPWRKRRSWSRLRSCSRSLSPPLAAAIAASKKISILGVFATVNPTNFQFHMA